MNTVKCALCYAEYSNINGLAKHIFNKHKNITKQEYYDKFFGEVSSTCQCGKKKKFRSLGEGYRLFCSRDCSAKYAEKSKPWEGKKQPQEMVDARRNTMLSRYGVTNGFLIKQHKAAVKYKGFVCRSGYEKLFIDFAEQYGWTLSVPKRIDYNHDGVSRHYYPDFYINELDLIVEVKSDWTWNQQLELNISKHVSVIEQGFSIVFIDEEDGLTDRNKWNELNELILSFE